MKIHLKKLQLTKTLQDYYIIYLCRFYKKQNIEYQMSHRLAIFNSKKRDNPQNRRMLDYFDNSPDSPTRIKNQRITKTKKEQIPKQRFREILINDSRIKTMNEVMINQASPEFAPNNQQQDNRKKNNHSLINRKTTNQRVLKNSYTPNQLKFSKLTKKSEAGANIKKKQADQLSQLSNLSKIKYLNSLARLQYQDRAMQVYTKISHQSKITVLNKIKAKNQLAQFQDECQQDQDINDLIEFKFGKVGKSNFITYFQKQQSDYLKNSLKLDNHQENDYDYFRQFSSKNIQPKYQQKNISQSQKFFQEQKPHQKKSKAIYCNKCDHLMAFLTYKNNHKNTCNFMFSDEPYEFNKELTDKLENIYKILIQLEDSSKLKLMKKYLGSILFQDSKTKIQQCISNLNKINKCESELLQTLKTRIIYLLQEKLKLKKISLRASIQRKSKI